MEQDKFKTPTSLRLDVPPQCTPASSNTSEVLFSMRLVDKSTCYCGKSNTQKIKYRIKR